MRWLYVLPLQLTAFAKTNSHPHPGYTVSCYGKEEGSDEYLSDLKKEYSSVTVACGYSNASMIAQLWRDSWPSDEYFPCDEQLSVGKNRRAWWYGGDSGEYHVYGKGVLNDESLITTVGYFANFAD